jgi:hypothetical protein
MNTPNFYNIQNQLTTNAVKPLLTANVLLSYATYQLNKSYKSVFNMNFFNMNCRIQPLCNIKGRHLTIEQAFANPNIPINRQLLLSALYKTANNSTYPFDLEHSPVNSIKALVSSELVPNGLPNSNLTDALKAADVNLSQVPTNRLSIITLAKDSVVTPNNFDDLLKRYSIKIKYAIKLDPAKIQVIAPPNYQAGYYYPYYENLDHGQALIYEAVYALNILNHF